MSFKKTVFFFIILLLLGGYYYIFEIRLAGKKQAAEEAAQKLFQLAENTIQELTLKRPDQEIVLKKQPQGWQLLQPVTAAADAQAVQNLLTALGAAQRDKTIAEKPADIQEFGLDKPELVVAFKTQANSAVQRLAIGKETPTTSGYYARVDDLPAVMTISAKLKTSLDKTVYDLRDKAILAFDPTALKQVVLTIKPPDPGTPQEIKLEQTNDQWKIIAPQAYPADTAKIGALLSNLKSSQIKAFIAEAPQDLAQYGLDQPNTTLSLVVGAENAPKTLLIGKSDAKQGGVYAKQAAAGNVFLIPTELAAAFPKNLNELRDKTLLALNDANLQKIELASAQETVALERSTPQPPSSGESQQEWKITQPAEFKADSGKIITWLTDARNVKAAQFIADEPANLASYGLEAPQLKLNFWEKDQPTPQQLLIGAADAQNTGVYAKLGAQNTVVLIKPEALKQLNKTAFDLRYRKILAFDSAAVEKLQVITHPKPLPGGESTTVTLLMEKNGNRWQAIAPEKQELLAYKVNNVLYDLAALEFQAEIPTPAADGSTYGFNAPSAEITFWTKGAQTGTTLLLGKQPAGQDILYAKTNAGATVYAIPPAFLNELPKTLQTLAE